MRITRPTLSRLAELMRQTGSFRPSELPELPPPVETPIRKVGVLLVHGIGNQRRGKTLTQFGEPLFNCLESWLRHHSGGAELEQVTIRDEPAPPLRTPAHAIVRMWYKRAQPAQQSESAAPAEDWPPAPQTDETRWLLAESNWADVFGRPSFGSVAFWSIRVVPWFILTQFVDQLSDDLRNARLGRALLGFSYLVLTFPLALLIQLLVLLLLPMSLLPPLRPVVAPIQRWISAVIGDTYVLLTSRFQFQSMVSTVREDLDWLVKQCDVVAVLAHSQGAAVAHEALRQAQEPKVERLITFGSAVSRLKALRYVMENASYMLTASTLVTVSALVMTGLFLWSLLSSGGSLLQLVFGLWGLGILLALSAYVMPFTLKQINEICHEHQDFALSDNTQWEDYYATADPVPNGQMLYKRNYTEQSCEVHNSANIFTDHSNYWKNHDEFGSAVLHSLMTLTGGPFATHGMPRNDVDLARSERKHRTRSRVAARVAALVAVSAAAFQHPVLKQGVSVPGPIQVPLGWFAGFVNWVLLLVGDAVGLVGSKLRLTAGDISLPKIDLPVDHLSWPIACICLVLLWHFSSASILLWWERLETKARFESSWSPKVKRPRRAWVMAVALLAVSWLGFWVWWIVLSPADLWAQLAAKLAPLAKATGNGSVLWIFIGYQLVDSIKKAWDSQSEISRMVLKTDDFTPPLSNPSLNRKIPHPVLQELNLSGMAGYVHRDQPSFLSLLRDVQVLLRDFVNGLSKGLSKRQVAPRFAAFVALFTALVSLAIVVFSFDIRGVVQAALGLMSLAFGVLAWVQGTDSGTRLVAAVGLVVGVLVMPTASAISAGLGTVSGAGLLVAGLASALCALSGAEFLRKGWAGVKPT